MKGRFFSGKHKDPHPVPEEFRGKHQAPGSIPPPMEYHRPRRPVRILPLLLMLIGTMTLLVLIVRYMLIPLLVMLGGAL